MTATIYDITVSPYFKATPLPVERQPLASTAETELGKAAETYFFASVGLRQPGMKLEDRAFLEGELRKLEQRAPNFRIRQQCSHHFAVMGKANKNAGDAA